MATPHTQRADKPANAKQQRYLRALAEQTGTTFSPPASSADASRQIEALKARRRDGRRDVVRERRQVQADMARRGATRPATGPPRCPATGRAPAGHATRPGRTPDERPQRHKAQAAQALARRA